MSKPKLLYANQVGEVVNHAEWLPTGRTAHFLTDIQQDEWIQLPEGATLTWLPGTRAVGVHPASGEFRPLGDDFYAVGALLPQGFTRLLVPGYVKRKDQETTLPLFGYTAVGWADDNFYVAAHPTDNPQPWDPTQLDEAMVERSVQSMLEKYPTNRLFEHLSHCALSYGCMTAKNTFVGGLEGALPVSSSCNAGCIGCISEQPDDSPFPSPQTRLDFRPTGSDIVAVMLEHIQANPEGIVSFGQGCEGEPATRWFDIVQAIRMVRAQTRAGYININTNAGLTSGIRAMVDAGLDMMRVSTISALPEHYTAYYKPRGYALDDVAASLQYAANHGVYTSINYLVFPGVSDREEEVEAMVDFLRRTSVKLVQMRNLNIDPEYYLAKIPPQHGELVGMRNLIDILTAECPGLQVGSYSHIPTARRPG